MDPRDRPLEERQPPRGVPRWLWPPPGATIVSCRIQEQVPAGAAPAYAVVEGPAPERRQLRALQWLLDEHARDELPPAGAPFEGEIVLEVARTEMPGGRVGHAFALNGGPLGEPLANGARGILWRYLHHRLDGA